MHNFFSVSIVYCFTLLNIRFLPLRLNVWNLNFSCALSSSAPCLHTALKDCAESTVTLIPWKYSLLQNGNYTLQIETQLVPNACKLFMDDIYQWHISGIRIFSQNMLIEDLLVNMWIYKMCRGYEIGDWQRDPFIVYFNN